MLPQQTAALFGNGHVDGLRFASGEELEADLVVIAAGIKPNAELGRKAGLEVNRGIVVNDFMETSDPDIFAVGECTEHRGQTFGLVAPLFDQGACWRPPSPAIAGRCSPARRPAAKLKIMGVDIFSAGSIDESEPGVETVRYEDPALGAYKKLLLKDNRLHGMILVGDIEDEHIYMDWMRSGTDLAPHAPAIAVPAAGADPGLEVADMPDSETICGCNGVRKGEIIEAIHKHGITTLGQLKERTRASTSCGSCAGLCEKLLRAVAPDFEEETQNHAVLLRAVLLRAPARDRARAEAEIGARKCSHVYGNRKGCEVCKPALSYMLDMLWCGDHEEDRSARFINDRVHANIQKDGTFSVVPRMRGGVTTPDELRRIADVADKYNVPMVKVTGSQRIDLLGVKKADLPQVWARSRHAFRPGLHQGRPHGEDLRGHGVLPLRRAGFHQRRNRTGAASGESVHAAQSQDGRGGMPAQLRRGDRERYRTGRPGWQLAGGGGRRGRQVRAQGRSADHRRDHRAGARSRRALLPVLPRKRQLPGAHLRFRGAAGIEKIRKETVYAPEEEKRKLLDRLHRSKALSQDAWLERDRPANATQFVQIEAMEISRGRDNSYDRERLDEDYAHRKYSSARRAAGADRRSRNRDLQSERPLPDHRERVPAQGRAAVRRHRYRHGGGLPAAWAALRSRDRHAGAGVGAGLSWRRSPRAWKTASFSSILQPAARALDEAAA